MFKDHAGASGDLENGDREKSSQVRIGNGNRKKKKEKDEVAGIRSEEALSMPLPPRVQSLIR